MMSGDAADELLQQSAAIQRAAENEIISSIYSGLVKACEPMETFSTWLLVGTTATATFLIANSDKLIPLLSTRGFLGCGLLLVLSSFCGLWAKMHALVARAGVITETAAMEEAVKRSQHFESTHADLRGKASQLGLQLDLTPDLRRVVLEVLEVVPTSMRRSVVRNLTEHGISYRNAARSVIKQMVWVRCQGGAFLAFLLQAFLAAAMTSLG